MKLALIVCYLIAASSMCRGQTDNITEVKVNSYDTIYLPHKILKGTIVVSNYQTGDVVLKMHFKNKSKLYIGDKIKKHGVYDYVIEDNTTDKVYPGKLFGY